MSLNNGALITELNDLLIVSRIEMNNAVLKVIYLLTPSSYFLFIIASNSLLYGSFDDSKLNR